MKFTKFLRSVRDRGTDFLGGATASKQETPQHGSYERLQSRVARVRFGAYALVAAHRRAVRGQVLSRIRQNTRGLPLGYALFQWLRGCDIRRLPLVLRLDRATKKWARGYHLRAQQAGQLQLDLDNGAAHRQRKLSKLARKVRGGKRAGSCSAMRWMVSVMERQEQLGRGTERLAIKQSAQYVSPAINGTPSRQQQRQKLRERSQAAMTKDYPFVARSERRRLARAALALLQRKPVTV